MARTISEQQVIDSASFKVLADPSRSLLVHRLGESAKSAKQLAAEMDCPITRLYYHLKLLQAHGLIFVERTRKVSGIFEKYYRASARAFVIDRNTDGQEDPARSQALLAFVFDQTRLDISNGLRSGRIDSGKLPPEVGALMAYRTVMKLSPAQAQELYSKLLALYREYDALAKAPGETGDFYALVASAYPTTAQQAAPGPKPRMRARPAAE
jgi:DNA-binding transcriptional ArsR family regulator